MGHPFYRPAFLVYSLSALYPMMKRDFHNNDMPLIVLRLITALNLGMLLNFLFAQMGGVEFFLNAMQIYIVAGLELAGVIFAYLVAKRRNTTLFF
jgi:hypothetical protein